MDGTCNPSRQNESLAGKDQKHQANPSRCAFAVDRISDDPLALSQLPGHRVGSLSEQKP